MQLTKIIPRFQGKKVIVIGDLMLDEYIWGKVDRISPEAPVPVMDVTRESYNPGGAANVAYNIHCLKGIPKLVGVVGDDPAGNKLLEILKEKRIDTQGIFKDPSRPTTTKTRLVVETQHQQMVRIDREKRHPISKELQTNVFDFVHSIAQRSDALLFEDYDKGMLDTELIKQIISSLGNKIITADPKFDNFFDYENVTLFKPNRKEVERATGVKINSQNIKSTGKEVREKLKCQGVLLTLGNKGMILFEGKGECEIPTKVREVYDETAAGDAAIAGATMALAAGASLEEAAYIANFTAGIEVGKFGAVPVTYEELLDMIENEK